MINIRKILVFLYAIFSVIIMVSSATAVPQWGNEQTNVNNFFKKNENKEISSVNKIESFLENFNKNISPAGMEVLAICVWVITLMLSAATYVTVMVPIFALITGFFAGAINSGSLSGGLLSGFLAMFFYPLIIADAAALLFI